MLTEKSVCGIDKLTLFYSVKPTVFYICSKMVVHYAGWVVDCTGCVFWIHWERLVVSYPNEKKQLIEMILTCSNHVQDYWSAEVITEFGVLHYQLPLHKLYFSWPQLSHIKST